MAAPKTPPYTHQHFPKMIYKGKESKTVRTPEEFQKAAGDGWVESPADTDSGGPDLTPTVLQADLDAAITENIRLREELARYQAREISENKKLKSHAPGDETEGAEEAEEKAADTVRDQAGQQREPAASAIRKIKR